MENSRYPSPAVAVLTCLESIPGLTELLENLLLDDRRYEDMMWIGKDGWYEDYQMLLCVVDVLKCIHDKKDVSLFSLTGQLVVRNKKCEAQALLFKIFDTVHDLYGDNFPL